MWSKGLKIDKRGTEAKVRSQTPPGWRFIRINWKNGIAHFADSHGRRVTIPMQKP